MLRDEYEHRMLTQTYGYNSIFCPVCGGSKTVRIETPIGKAFILQHCGRCKGTGKVIQHG